MAGRARGNPAGVTTTSGDEPVQGDPADPGEGGTVGSSHGWGPGESAPGASDGEDGDVPQAGGPSGGRPSR